MRQSTAVGLFTFVMESERADLSNDRRGDNNLVKLTKTIQFHKISQEKLMIFKNVLWDRVNSLKRQTKISPAVEEQNAMFNKSKLLKSCHCKEILKCAKALAEADGIHHAIFKNFSPLLEIISHKTISTFFMSNGQWLQRHWRVEVRESEKRKLTTHERQNINISCTITEHVSASMRSLFNWKKYK